MQLLRRRFETRRALAMSGHAESRRRGAWARLARKYRIDFAGLTDAGVIIRKDSPPIGTVSAMPCSTERVTTPRRIATLLSEKGQRA
jgi:hypothetical protein